MTFNQVATKTTPRRWNMAVESNNNLSSHLVDRTSGVHLHHKTIARTSRSAGYSSYRFKTFHNNFKTHKKRKQQTSTCALLGLTFFPIVPFFRHFIGKVAKRFLVCAMASLWYSSHHSRRRPVSCQGHRMLRGFDWSQLAMGEKSYCMSTSYPWVSFQSTIIWPTSYRSHIFENMTSVIISLNTHSFTNSYVLAPPPRAPDTCAIIYEWWISIARLPGNCTKQKEHDIFPPKNGRLQHGFMGLVLDTIHAWLSVGWSNFLIAGIQYPKIQPCSTSTIKMVVWWPNSTLLRSFYNQVVEVSTWN